jgi:tetratricopeptide (TPR) repeat protein
VHAALAALALQRGRVDEAERRYLETLAIAPNFVEAMATLGFIHAQRGDEAGAQAWYEQAIAADPTYPHAHRRLADLFYGRKDYARALTYYDRTLSVLPQDFVALIQAGNSARFIGDPKTAAARYEEARAARPDSWIPPYNLACLRALNGRPEEALAFLNDALRAGFANPQLLEENEDFVAVRGTPEWDALLAQARVAAERKETPRRADGPAAS